MNRPMEAGEVRAVLAQLGAGRAAGSPEEFARLIDLEVARWARFAKAANVKVE